VMSRIRDFNFIKAW